MIPSLSTMPLGLNAGTLLPGALSLRWYSPFLSRSAASEPHLYNSCWLTPSARQPRLGLQRLKLSFLFS